MINTRLLVLSSMFGLALGAQALQARSLECVGTGNFPELRVKVNTHTDNEKKAVFVLSNDNVAQGKKTIYVDKAARVNDAEYFKVYSKVDQTAEGFRGGENLVGTKLKFVKSIKLNVVEILSADGIEEDGVPFSVEAIIAELVVNKLPRADGSVPEAITEELHCQ